VTDVTDFTKLQCYGGSPEKRDKERERKRRRYAEDPELRRRKIDSAKSRYQKQKHIGWAGDAGPPPKKVGRRIGGRNKSRPWILPNGRVINLVGVGEAADICCVSKRTLINYETKGVIPCNRLKDERGRRWYPKVFAEWLSSLLKDQSETREPLWRLRRRVETAWREVQQTMPVLEESNDPN